MLFTILLLVTPVQAADTIFGGQCLEEDSGGECMLEIVRRWGPYGLDDALVDEGYGDATQFTATEGTNPFGTAWTIDVDTDLAGGKMLAIHRVTADGTTTWSVKVTVNGNTYTRPLRNEDVFLLDPDAGTVVTVIEPHFPWVTPAGPFGGILLSTYTAD